MPMSTPFILSARSKDRELKGIKTARIPGPVGDDDAGATGSRPSTQSDHGSNVSYQSDPLGDATRDEGKSAGGKASAGLSMAPPGEGWKPSNIDFGGGSASAKKAKKKSKERRRHKTGRQPPPPRALALASHSSGRSPWLRSLARSSLQRWRLPFQPPTADEVVLVFTPITAQHLFGDPVGPGGQTSDGFNQPILLEFPSLDPPVTSKCNCVEWEELKADFATDFRRLSQADFNRMELSRAGDKAVAQGDVAAMTVANGIYTSSFHSLKGSYQELLRFSRRRRPRSVLRLEAGGPAAGGDAAASSLVFELADLLFKVFREQWHRFKAQRQEVLLSIKDGLDG
jgi:hypothetical protein